MADEQPNKYAAMLADLESERAKIDAAIAAIRPLAGVEGAESVASATGATQLSAQRKPELPTKIEFDTFFSLNIPEAIKKFLAMMKRPQTVSAITEALRTGGLSTTAEDLMGTITATLTRMRRTTGEVVPVRRGEWGLKEWYPGRKFDTPEPKKKPKKGSRKAKTQKSSTAKQSKPKATVTETQPSPPASEKSNVIWKPTPEQIAQIKALHATGKKPGEISKETGVAPLVVGKIVAREAKLAEAAKA